MTDEAYQHLLESAIRSLGSECPGCDFPTWHDNEDGSGYCTFCGLVEEVED